MHISLKSMRQGKVALILFAALLNGGCGCNKSADPASPEYEKVVSTFTIGAVALETNDPDHTTSYLTEMTKVAPDEPAGWANLGLSQLRGNQLKEATESLNRATSLLTAPNAGIEKILAILADRNGNLPEEIKHLQKALELNPADLRSRYALCESFERLNTAEGDTSYQSEAQTILEKQPNNLRAIMMLTQIAAKRKDTETLKKTISALELQTTSFNTATNEKLKLAKAALASGNMPTVSISLRTMENLLKENSSYRAGSLILQKPKTAGVGDPIQDFIKLPKIPAAVAPADMGTTFVSAPLSDKFPAGKASFSGGFWLDEKGTPVVMSGDGSAIQVESDKLPFPGGAKATPPSPNGVLAIDTNYDLKSDLIFAGAGGLKFYLQTDDGKFTDATSKSTLSPKVLQASYTGAWSCDIEADGDLDVVLGSAGSAPTVLQNNADDTWKEIHPFAKVNGLHDFVWLDLDGDGSSDAALIDGAGKLRIFMNLRAGVFQERKLPESVGKMAAISVADANNDGKLDLIALQSDGVILRISDTPENKDWTVAEIARWKTPPGELAAGSAKLIVADLDNNGALDILASTPKGSQIWLRSEKNTFEPLPAPIPGSISAVMDLDKDGRLDLVGLSPEGQSIRFTNHGTLNYAWQEMRLRAHDTEVAAHKLELKAVKENGKKSVGGDRLTNTFGIGGEIETRTGLNYQKQRISGPVVHIGLGSHKALDVVRILWPNGDIKSEFGGAIIKENATVEVMHRLSSSCPWVFAWNGKTMGFVTDFIWRSPVGLRINAQDTAGIAQTEDWVKIRGEQLVPRDGTYDVRITAELWETHFFDFIRLMTVDHPANVDIYVDERFSIPPPKLAVHTLLPLQPLAKAIDDNGADVTDTLKNLDATYLDTFGRGDYQGITRDHFVELDLGTNTPTKGVYYLVASGWIHPTNSSINVAISQGKHSPPQGLSLEVADGKGGWRVAQTGLGFPAGKMKTILLRLDDVFRPGEPKRIRMRTNLEIFWDRIAVGAEAPSVKIDSKRLEPSSAKLSFRGYSETNQANPSSPELPDYERISGTGQRWRDLIGYCTRFGDVDELLKSVDDRYVIMNAGDEMQLRFPVPAAPPAGWKRDFVLIGDGWEKDGNLNTAYSKTVLPLPFHGMKTYDTPGKDIASDPVYRKNPQDWQNYHTRFITPESVRTTLLPREK